MKGLEKAAAIITIIGFPVLVVSMLFVFYQIEELKQVASSQNNIALNTEFFNDTNTGIISAIENDQPILIEDKGKYTDAQLDNYLGDFDTISDAYDEGLLSENDFCDSFSYYVQITASSSEIQKYMISEGSSYYSGLPELSVAVDESKDKICQ